MAPLHSPPRADPVVHPSPLRVAARRRRLSRALSRPAHRQLRWVGRRGVCGGARRQHRKAAVENFTAQTMEPCLLDTTRHSRRRGRPGGFGLGAYRTVAYEPLTGKEIWRVSYGEGFSNVPRPVFGLGQVFIATGFQEPALMAVRVGGSGDVTRTPCNVDAQARCALYTVAAARR